MRDHYFRKGHGFLVVYSVVNRPSFGSLEGYRKHILRVKEQPAYPMVFVANKIDMDDRDVTTAEGQQLATQLSVPYIETSAKTGHNIEECFCMVVREIRKYMQASAGSSDDHEDIRKAAHERKKRGHCALL